MDRNDNRLPRASTVDATDDDCWMLKNRRVYSKARGSEINERKQGINKIVAELQQRKERQLGDGSSLYLQRRYDQ